MKKIGFLFILFLSLQISLYSQTKYVQSTTDASLANQPLLHNNELKIGNSTSATERAKNMIKIGDNSYIQIGEWEADNLLSFKASKYNFTNGYVGIGTTAPTVPLEVNGAIKATSLSLSGNLTSNNFIVNESLQVGSSTNVNRRLRFHSIDLETHSDSYILMFRTN
jgi:hypothetical protein